MWEWPNLFSLVSSIFIGQIYFHWSNLYCGIYMVYVPVPQKFSFFFWKIPRSKKALFVNVGMAESIFTGQIYFHWPKKALFVIVGVAESIFTGQIY